jgi:hypothetical protein
VSRLLFLLLALPVIVYAAIAREVDYLRGR